MSKIKNKSVLRNILISMLAGIFVIMCLRDSDAQTSQLFRVYSTEVSGKIAETSEAVAAGKKIYEIKCYYCHGIKGDGNGSDAPRLDPKPRNFTRNEYKIRSTGPGVLPTDEDLYRIISSGVEGSAMPFWNTLKPEERWQVIFYIKTFNPEFKNKSDRSEVSLAGGTASSPDSIKRGKKLFKEAKCILCHGEDGRGEGPITTTLKKQWDLQFKARDLTQSWMYKGGNTEGDIFRTITTGLNETPMGSYADYLTDDDRWHLSHYVKSISHDMKTDVVLKSKLLEGNLPKGPDDVAWDTLEAVELPLAGQIVASPRFWTPSANSIRIRSFYNDKNIAFLVEWDDRTNEQSEIYSDAVALQFPTKIPEGLKKPYFAMGDSSKGVELLHWKAYDESVLTVQSSEEDNIETEADGGSEAEDEPDEAESEETADEEQEDELVSEGSAMQEFEGFFSIKEMNAKGFKRLSVQPDASQNSKGKGHWKNGKWQVMITRPLFTRDKKIDVQFEKGKLIPYALAVWDGSNSEIKGQKAISSWYYLTLEMTTPNSVYIYAIVAVIMAICIQFWVVARIRRFPTEIPEE
ncbi:cytochrome c [Candidatus Scalindua japonica]|uniref:Cytochrome c n=1 Tax=Candidatus Scalindua japonica TaxID=1284222 RepID=A0A286U2U0_9BACT|nr:ethylbenzene dehydrogenase-related protein [Candidatus Scalindua japonica]GAX62460.1 cytochrome c [Candidatus Scalindua japonica]